MQFPVHREPYVSGGFFRFMEGRMKRREQRECIFQLLFRLEFNGQEEMPEQTELFVEDMKEAHNPGERDEAYILEKYKKVVERLPEIDPMLEKVSEGWKLSRMGKVELTVLRLAVYEMKYDEDIPEKVAINEAVELSRKFGGDEAPGFVNGVLAKFTKKQET